MTLQLSPLTTALVERLFQPQEHTEAKRILIEECGNNLPLCNDQTEVGMERIRFGALRLSVGDLEELQRAVSVAKSDWRDLLVAARFADGLTTHQRWAESALKENPTPLVLILVGLTGSGKTTIGNLLSHELGWMYYEGDTFHTTPNFARFIHGQSITQEDTQAWLTKLSGHIHRYVNHKQNLILACTALKESQRESLRIADEVRFVYLYGSTRLLEDRQKQRTMQLSNLERLTQQIAQFEEPQNALRIEADKSPAEIAASIRKAFTL